MNSKKTSIALTIITIINIVLLIYGFVTGLLSPNSFNESLDRAGNNMIFVIITFANNQIVRHYKIWEMIQSIIRRY